MTWCAEHEKLGILHHWIVTIHTIGIYWILLVCNSNATIFQAHQGLAFAVLSQRIKQQATEISASASAASCWFGKWKTSHHPIFSTQTTCETWHRRTKNAVDCKEHPVRGERERDVLQGCSCFWRWKTPFNNFIDPSSPWHEPNWAKVFIEAYLGYNETMRTRVSHGAVGEVGSSHIPLFLPGRAFQKVLFKSVWHGRVMSGGIFDVCFSSQQCWRCQSWKWCWCCWKEFTNWSTCKVHNNAGSDCILKESVQLNFDEDMAVKDLGANQANPDRISRCKSLALNRRLQKNTINTTSFLLKLFCEVLTIQLWARENSLFGHLGLHARHWLKPDIRVSTWSVKSIWKVAQTLWVWFVIFMNIYDWFHMIPLLSLPFTLFLMLATEIPVCFLWREVECLLALVTWHCINALHPQEADSAKTWQDMPKPSYAYIYISIRHTIFIYFYTYWFVPILQYVPMPQSPQ